jgi:hypothetical protein
LTAKRASAIRADGQLQTLALDAESGRSALSASPTQQACADEAAISRKKSPADSALQYQPAEVASAIVSDSSVKLRRRSSYSH